MAEHTHSHHGLGHSGEHGGPERVQQDLVLQQDKVQQRGAVLRAQIHQQSAVVCPAGKGGMSTEEMSESTSFRGREWKTKQTVKGEERRMGRKECEQRKGWSERFIAGFVTRDRRELCKGETK